MSEKEPYRVKIDDNSRVTTIDRKVTTIEGMKNIVFSVLSLLPKNQYEIIGLLEGMNIEEIDIDRYANDNSGEIKINNVWLDMKLNSETNKIYIINHDDFFNGTIIGDNSYPDSLINTHNSNLLKYELGNFKKVYTHALYNGKIYEIVGLQDGMDVTAINKENRTLTINNERLLSFTINEEKENIELMHLDNYYFLSMYGSIYPYNDSNLKSRSEITCLYEYINLEFKVVKKSSGTSFWGEPTVGVKNFQELLEEEGGINKKLKKSLTKRTNRILNDKK